jgi:hypothetical protein
MLRVINLCVHLGITQLISSNINFLSHRQKKKQFINNMCTCLISANITQKIISNYCESCVAHVQAAVPLMVSFTAVNDIIRASMITCTHTVAAFVQTRPPFNTLWMFAL